jgi:Fe-S-cluster containining protein
MASYELTWITDQLAAGHAPMSYADLDDIKALGVSAIVNLCGEYCDLHEIEEQSGFEVYYFPIPDENAPDMEAMEEVLAWLDEAIYLGKKVLVHCRFGVGRTGTLITAYLLRKGFGLKLAQKRLKKIRANPTSFSQWRLLRRYGKKSGVLKIREPSLENRQLVDLGPYFAQYEALVAKTEEDIAALTAEATPPVRCGDQTDACCFRYVELQLMETIYLNNRMNATLPAGHRETIIHDSLAVVKTSRNLFKQIPEDRRRLLSERKALYDQARIRCPLSREGRCLMYEHRPLGCRLFGTEAMSLDRDFIEASLAEMSRSLFFTFSGFFLEGDPLVFSLADTVSGRFVQRYFYTMAANADINSAL